MRHIPVSHGINSDSMHATASVNGAPLIIPDDELVILLIPGIFHNFFVYNTYVCMYNFIYLNRLGEIPFSS